MTLDAKNNKQSVGQCLQTFLKKRGRMTGILPKSVRSPAPPLTHSPTVTPLHVECMELILDFTYIITFEGFCFFPQIFPIDCNIVTEVLSVRNEP